MTISTVDLSVIVAVFNEDPRNLLRLLQRLAESLAAAVRTYEVIFVDDGSGPDTHRALRQIARQVDYVKLIVLSRNFGQQAAITAGLDHAAGEAVVNLDSDLQDPPEMIPAMIELWKQGWDVVYAQRSTRRDSVGKRLSACLFYRLLETVSSVRIPRDTGDFRLLDRKVVDALAAIPERTRFLRGLVPWVGFRQIGIPIDRGARQVGESTYTLRRLVKLAADGLLSFSSAPLYLVPITGAVIIAGGAALLVQLFLWASSIAGGTAVLLLLAVLLMMGGLQIIATGVVAVYLARVLDEARARPTYVVAERLGIPSASGESDCEIRNQRQGRLPVELSG